MKRKTILIILLSLLLIVTASGLYIWRQWAAEEKSKFLSEISFYEDIMDSEKEWITSNQLSNGAYVFRTEKEGGMTVNPYFSDMAAQALLTEDMDETTVQSVQNYFTWHLNHLNTSEEDINGIDGTIYEYTVYAEDGEVIEEISQLEYDSVDSYAATFLIVLWEYYDVTKDKDYILNHSEDICRVISALLSTIDTDGLSIVKADYPVKYLMDNTEVNQGLNCAEMLLEEVLLTAESGDDLMQLQEQIGTVLEANTISIEDLLWNDEENRYEIGLDNSEEILDFDGWQSFYPDAVAQLFPITYEIIDSDSDRAQYLYNRFSEEYKWEDFEHNTNGDAEFYWAYLAYVGAEMKDYSRVKSYLQYYKNEIMEDHDYPAYIADSAWVVRSCEKAISDYEDRMEMIDPFNIVNVE